MADSDFQICRRQSTAACRLWIVASIFALLPHGTALAAEKARPPNVVLILADDLGWSDLGCYGNTWHETPHLDRLAASGMRFTNGYAACPVCSPTRASLMTGKYPARLHLTDWLPGRGDRPAQKLLRPAIVQQLPLEEITIAEALQPAGYISASIGKWHLGAEPFWPEKQGFAVNLGGTQTGSPPGGYFNFKTPSLSAATPDEYLTDRLTAEAVNFIRENKERPFFLYLPHYAVHIPMQAKTALLAKYEAKPRDGGPHANAIYAAMLESLDASVGRVVQTLTELNLTEQTIVIFTSDNGGLSVKEGPQTPATSNAPLRAGKGFLYEGGIRTPWIVAWPGKIAAQAVCDRPISSVDLYPTLLELAGVQPAAAQIIDGASFTPLLKLAGDYKRAPLFWHYPHYANQGLVPGGMIRDGRYKLIEFFETGALELYDLETDVSEQQDLSDEMPDRTRALHQQLVVWRKSVDAQSMSPNPDYRP